jgi:hypothetical protein
VKDALERGEGYSAADWRLESKRARALLSEGEAAERLYGEAIARLSRTRVRAVRGRADLLFGEWLRRGRRRLDARGRLRTREMFIGRVRAFAARVERELLATGERARKRHRRDARAPHRPGGRDRPAGRRRLLKPRDRRATAPQPQDRRVPPEEPLQQCWASLPHPARPRAPATDRRGAAGLNQAGVRRDR